MTSKTPWRKRLEDFLQLIRQADLTYFEPDLFRLNINSAIQTARTVTFIIQKNKKLFPEYDILYATEVLKPFALDPVMVWLKDSRNVIEKEGDLSIYSQVKAQLLFSYTTDGPELVAPCENLLFVGAKRLRRMWLRTAPSGVIKDTVLMVDRTWIANSLPDLELTNALLRGYSRLKRVVDLFDKAVGQENKGELEERSVKIGSSGRREYVKLSDGKTYRLKSSYRITRRGDATSARKRYALAGEVVDDDDSLTLSDRMENFAKNAVAVFNADGFHAPMYMLFDENGKLTTIGSVHFADRVDKYIFWKMLADQVAIDISFKGIVFIAEAWRKTLGDYPITAISDLPVVGEVLSLIGANSKGEYSSITLQVTRSGEKPLVDIALRAPDDFAVPNFLIPIRRAWGINSDVSS
jgi:hypothetical protein